MQKYSSFTLPLFLCLLLSSCGYRLGHGPLSNKYRGISVPIVYGDHTGSFTRELIQTLNVNGYCYENCDSPLELRVKILHIRDENIGFRYDRDKEGKITNSIVPAETRRTATAEVTLLDNASCCPVLGPSILKASVSFDHDYNSSRNGINVFSLGQLTDVYEARDASIDPLNQRLAQKIVDYLSSVW